VLEDHRIYTGREAREGIDMLLLWCRATARRVLFLFSMTTACVEPMPEKRRALSSLVCLCTLLP
jgi:hypothetical protein